MKQKSQSGGIWRHAEVSKIRRVYQRSVSGLPLVVEIVQLLEDGLHLLDGGDEVGDSEVVGAGFLLETTAWHCHDAGLVNHVHAVQEVGLATLRMRLVDELLREVDAGESVHGTFDLCAGHVLHVTEGRAQQAGLRSQRLVELSVFSLVECNCLVRLYTLLCGVDHQLAGSLSNSVGAELDGLEFEHHCFGFV